MVMPLHRVNVLTGVKAAIVLDDATEYAALVKQARRPLLVLGPKVMEVSLGDKLLLDYALELAEAGNMPICATSHVKGKMVERETSPEAEYDVVEMVNFLKDPDWHGVRNEGQHDVVLFLGFRTDVGNQVLSTLKHFARHLRTMTLCKYFYPNADYSLPNIRDDEEWRKFLEELTSIVKEDE